MKTSSPVDGIVCLEQGSADNLPRQPNLPSKRDSTHTIREYATISVIILSFWRLELSYTSTYSR